MHAVMHNESFSTDMQTVTLFLRRFSRVHVILVLGWAEQMVFCGGVGNNVATIFAAGLAEHPCGCYTHVEADRRAQQSTRRVAGRQAHQRALPRTDIGIGHGGPNTCSVARQVVSGGCGGLFFYSRRVQNLSSMPDFVVGRRAYDNWLVDHAFHNTNIVLIDASRTILALHLTTGDGNKAGHHKGADNNWNVNVLNPATQKKVHRGEWDHGTTNHCPFFTLKHGADVAIRRRF